MLIQNDIPMLPASNVPRIEEPGVSIRDVVDLLVEGRKTILLTVVSVLLVASLYLILAPRTYKADGMLRIDKNKALLTAPLRSQEWKSPGDAENPRAQREVEIMSSRSVLGKVVEDLHLAVESSPKYFPIIGETLARWHDRHEGPAGAWWGFGRWAWGGETLKVADFDVPERFLGKEFTIVALEAGRYQLLGPEDELLVEGKVGAPSKAKVGERGFKRSMSLSALP